MASKGNPKVADIADKSPIIGATECEWYHEDHCIAKCELGENFVCDGMKDNGLLVECHNTNADLVLACGNCESRPAEKDDELCKECREYG